MCWNGRVRNRIAMENFRQVAGRKTFEKRSLWLLLACSLVAPLWERRKQQFRN